MDKGQNTMSGSAKIVEGKKRAVVLLSGGMDSTTLLYDVMLSYDIYALTVHYGQRHLLEVDCARETCQKLNIEHRVVDLSAIKPLLKGSSLTDDISVPEGHYEDESMKLTVVPNRNMILLSLGIAYAISISAKTVFYAAHSGDHAIYPDCRKEFVKAMQSVAKLCHYHKIKLNVPYLDADKVDIARIGERLNVDYLLTWTCYNPQFVSPMGKERISPIKEYNVPIIGKGKITACGKCGSCNERLEAFRKACVHDPIKYAIDDGNHCPLCRSENITITKGDELRGGCNDCGWSI